MPRGFVNGYCCHHHCGGFCVQLHLLVIHGHEEKNVAWRVKSGKGVSGSHKVVMSVCWGQEGASVGIEDHPLSQFCHKCVIVQCLDCLLSHVILGHEVQGVALKIKSHNLANGAKGLQAYGARRACHWVWG